MSRVRSASKRRKLRTRRQLRHRVERLEAQVARLAAEVALIHNPPQLVVVSEAAAIEMLRRP